MNELVVKFGREYDFEGKKIAEVDLSGLENLTAADMIEADRYMLSQKAIAMIDELALPYVFFMAAKVSELPVEFFKQLKLKDAMKVKSAFGNFLGRED